MEAHPSSAVHDYVTLCIPRRRLTWLCSSTALVVWLLRLQLRNGLLLLLRLRLALRLRLSSAC